MKHPHTFGLRLPPLQDKEDLCWSQPVPYATVNLEGEPVTRHRAWLPHAIAVTADPEGWTVAVQVGPGCERSAAVHGGLLRALLLSSTAGNI